MPAVEEYGIEPIPPELRTVGWRDLFAINFTFFVNPVMYVIGGLAVVQGGLPLPWAVAATVLGQALAYAILVVIAQPGVDDGLPGQVAMRASLGYWGARLLSSPYRIVAATYWFAAQALTAALGFQAIMLALTETRYPLVPVALAFAAFHAVLAVLGFDVTRWLLRIVLPVSVALTVLLVGVFVAADDPQYALGRVLDSPDQSLTWIGFATYVTVMCGASLTLVTSVADYCRYTPTRRDMRIGYAGSAVLAVAVTTFVGGYAAAATGDVNPFVAVAGVTTTSVVLVAMLVALAVQGIAANVTNTYTAGLSLVNAVPSLGRIRATVVVAALAMILSGFPEVIERAQDWIAHLGNLGAPLAGVVLADYALVRAMQTDVPALFDPAGRYAYFHGVNVEAIAAIAVGAACYYAVPDSWVKVVWGVGIAAAAYLGLVAVTRRHGVGSDRLAAG
ncbi:MAG TPA: cytosine permease [Gaiellaceae bacterium]|nr:cytosine permease [Gaiellaceae bacterium]